MAGGRPLEEGLSYFEMNTNIFGNKKIRLIESQFPRDGLYLFVKLLTEIYKDKGYYLRWDDDALTLLSGDTKLSTDKINEILLQLLHRDLFNKPIFDNYQVLTSEEIQKRYLNAARRRELITLITPYILVSAPETILKIKIGDSKLSFVDFDGVSVPDFRVSGNNNSVNVDNNSVNVAGNGQSRVEYSRVEKSILDSGNKISGNNNSEKIFSEFFNKLLPELLRVPADDPILKEFDDVYDKLIAMRRTDEEIRAACTYALTSEFWSGQAGFHHPKKLLKLDRNKKLYIDRFLTEIANATNKRGSADRGVNAGHGFASANTKQSHGAGGRAPAQAAADQY